MTILKGVGKAAVLTATLLAAPSAFTQSLITVYKNDFETPNPAQMAAEICRDGGATPATNTSSYGTFAQNYNDPANGFIFQQINTADRLCSKAVNNPTDNPSHTPAWIGTGYADTLRPANKFAGGMIRQSGDYSYIETVGLVFPTHGQKFMDLSMDWSGLAVQLEGQNPADPGGFYNKVWVNRPNKDYAVKLRFFRLEATDTLSLQNQFASDALVRVNGTPATPVRTEIFQFSSTSTDGLSFDWRSLHYALDMAGMGFTGPTQRLGVVWNLDSDNSYAGFDNILVTASEVPAAQVVKGVNDEHTLPNISDTFAIPDVTSNDSVQGGSTQIDKSSVKLLSTPQYGTLSIPDPTHPELILYTPDGVYSGDVSFQYSVCDTSTPTPACVDQPVTVTLHIPPKVVPNVNLACTPSEIFDSPNQVSTCTLTSNAPVGVSGLSINLTLPSSNPRYSTNCASPLVIPAGSTSATCTITATPNTVVGDGDVVASIAIAAPNTPTDYVVTGTPAQVTVKDDDKAPPQPTAATPVPTLGDWAILTLSALTIGVAGFFTRRRVS